MIEDMLPFMDDNLPTQDLSRFFDGTWETPPSPQHHACQLPPMTYQDAARSWRCNTCSAQWTLVRTQPGSVLQMPLPKSQVVGVPGLPEERYAPTDLRAPNVEETLPLPEGNLTSLSEHATTCAHRLGTGMCSCSKRNEI